MDITPIFNQALAAHNAGAIKPYEFRTQDLDEFVKEAYRIVCRPRCGPTLNTTEASSDHTLQTYTST
jgi:hypothetical protein